MRRNLAIVSLIIGAFLFLIIYLAIQPYLPTIGKVVFIIFLFVAGLVVLLALAGFGTAMLTLFSKISQLWFSMQKKQLELELMRAELARKQANLDVIITDEGQRAYAFLRRPGDNREVIPLADPRHVTINNKAAPATVHEEQPVQPLLDGPRLPEAESFRAIWPGMSARRVVLGYRLVQGVSRPIYATLALLLSSLIVGRPGTGKTSLLRFLVAIILKAGGFVLLWDAHNSVLKQSAQHRAVHMGFREGQRFTRRGDERPGHLVYLARSFAEMKASLEALEALLELRIQLGEDHPFMPVFWMADEWLEAYENVPDAGRVLRRVVTEGRKYRMYAAISGHNFNAEAIGGTKVKHNSSTQFAFRTHEQQAKLVGFEMAQYRELFLSIIDEEFGDIPEEGLMEEHDPSAGWCLVKASVLKPTLIKITQVEAGDMSWVFDQVMSELSIATPQDLIFEEEEGFEGFDENGYGPGPSRDRNYLASREPQLQPLPLQTLASQLWTKARAQGGWQPPPEIEQVYAKHPGIEREVILHIWFWYVEKRRVRRDLRELMGGEGNGGRYYQRVIKPVCDSIDKVRVGTEEKEHEEEEVVG